MKKIFTEFNPADYETWLTQIKKDLKDKPLEALISNPEKDIEVKAYYHHDKNKFNGTENTFSNNSDRASNLWKIRKIYNAGTNNKILSNLNDGIDAVGLVGIDQKQFDSDVAEILFEHITSDVKFETKQSAISIKIHSSAFVNFDVISLNAAQGEWDLTLEDFFECYQAKPTNKTIWIDGNLYGDSGATTIQELAFSIAHLNEYIRFLKDKKIDLKTINDKIAIELSVNENYFVNISKYRAIRELIALLFSGYDEKYQVISPVLFAKTSLRFIAENDHNNNLLRETTQAMSAILGGCDVLTVTEQNSDHIEQQELNERMAKNIQLILREESYFDKVNDPGSGSYYLEELTDQLIEKAWKLFLHIENKGGLIECLKNNIIQNLIGENKKYLNENIANGELTLLGVNKFQSKLEKWITIESKAEDKNTAFKKLSSFRLEEFYSQKSLTK